MSLATAEGGADIERLKVCPHCDLATRSVDPVCPICWRDLRTAPVLSLDDSIDRAARDRATLARRARAQRRRRMLRRAAAVAVLGVVAGGVYTQWIRAGPSPLPAVAAPELSIRAGADGWPAFGADAGAARVTPASAALEGEVAWRTALPAPPSAPIVADRTTLYVPLTNARLIALSVVDGRERWSVPVPGQLDGSPAIAGGRLYAGFRDQHVVAIDAATGAQVWTVRTRNAVFSAPVVVDGVVWAVSSSEIVALDAVSGEVLHRQALESRSGVSIVAVADRIVVPVGRDLLLFDRATGAQTYHFRFPAATAVAGVGGTIVAVAEDRALSLDTGARRPWWDFIRNFWGQLGAFKLAPSVPLPPHNWLQRVPESPLAPALRSDRAFLTFTDGAVRAYDLLSGETVWEAALAPIASGPVLTPDGLLVTAEDALVLLDPESGAELARRTFPGLVLRATLVTDHGTYVRTADNELLALR